jgi:phage FluMu gp28-like protein
MGELLLPYQRAWIADKSRFKIGLWARQTGKTWSATLELVWDCVQAEWRGARRRWVILSRGERQAREAMNEGVLRHLQVLETVHRAVEYNWAPGITAYQASLPGGSRITALPANPDTARGFSASVLLDEFAFHHDSRRIWRALFPVISAGHNLRVVSTPNGKNNLFYELMTSPAMEKIWSRHVVNIHRAIADGLPRDVEELQRGIGDDDAWRQEFLIEWLDEASAWLPYDLIDGCEDVGAGKSELYAGGLCYLGMDIAARGDLTVIWCLEQVGDVLWARERVELARAPFATQLAEISRLMGRYRIVRAALDQTGMGEGLLQQAQREHGTTRIVGVLFTPAAKLDMASALKCRMEERTLRLPHGDIQLRNDLHSVKRAIGPTGIPRLIAEREGGSHADRFWALALAVSAASAGAAKYAYHPMRQRQETVGTQSLVTGSDHLRSRRAEDVAAAAQPHIGGARHILNRRGIF